VFLPLPKNLPAAASSSASSPQAGSSSTSTSVGGVVRGRGLARQHDNSRASSRSRSPILERRDSAAEQCRGPPSDAERMSGDEAPDLFPAPVRPPSPPPIAPPRQPRRPLAFASDDLRSVAEVNHAEAPT
ncbi:unnamed protein product, partial [Amoebophrya sp. A120]